MQKPNNVVCQLIQIDVEKAAELLKNMHPNRKVSPALVDKYAREISANNWRINGESIVISNIGRVLDGQHRLRAVVESGIPIWTVLVTGVEEGAMNTFDTGRTRSAADIFGMTGHQNARHLAALLLLVWQYERVKPGTWPHGSASMIELYGVLTKYPQASSSIDYCLQVAEVCSPSLVAFVHLLGPVYGNDLEKTKRFIEKLATGADLPLDSPALVLRNQLLQTGGHNRRNRRDPIPRLMQLAWIIRAYNREIAGGNLKHITVQRKGDFPQITGRPLTAQDDLFAMQPVATPEVQ